MAWCDVSFAGTQECRPGPRPLTSRSKRRASDGQTIRACGRRLGVRASSQLAFDGADAANLLLELVLGTPIRFEDEVPRLAQVVELVESRRRRVPFDRAAVRVRQVRGMGGRADA